MALEIKGESRSVKSASETVVHKIERDTEGRIIDLEIETENARLCLLNLSAPTNNDPNFFWIMFMA